MWGMQETRGMFTRIPGNLLVDSGECSYFGFPENAQEDSEECSRGFWGMFKKIPGNTIKDSGKCYQRFLGILKKISGNVP